MEILPQAFGIWCVLYAAVAYMLFLIVSVWVVYEKAGWPGWVSLIPIVNMYALHKIADKPAWWLILYFIPIVSLVVILIVYIGLAQNFGRSALYGLGLAFLSFVFFPHLAFGEDEYTG